MKSSICRCCHAPAAVARWMGEWKDQNRETGVGREAREDESGGGERGIEGRGASEGNEKYIKNRCIEIQHAMYNTENKRTPHTCTMHPHQSSPQQINSLLSEIRFCSAGSERIEARRKMLKCDTNSAALCYTPMLGVFAARVMP